MRLPPTPAVGEANIKRSHTPLSLLLGLAGVASILGGIFLLHLLPPQLSFLLNSFYFLIPVGLLFWSLKTMKLTDEQQLNEQEKREKIIRYVAAYTRLIAGLMIFSAFGIFVSGWKIRAPYSTYDIAFLILIVVVSLVALIFTTLQLRGKSIRFRGEGRRGA